MRFYSGACTVTVYSYQYMYAYIYANIFMHAQLEHARVHGSLLV